LRDQKRLVCKSVDFFNVSECWLRLPVRLVTCLLACGMHAQGFVFLRSLADGVNVEDGCLASHLHLCLATIDASLYKVLSGRSLFVQRDGRV